MRFFGNDVQAAATGVAVFLVVTIIAALINANVEELAKRHGWHGLLVRLSMWLPSGMRRMLAGWPKVRRQWWIWLALGLTTGYGAIPSAMQIATEWENGKANSTPIPNHSPEPHRSWFLSYDPAQTRSRAQLSLAFSGFEPAEKASSNVAAWWFWKAPEFVPNGGFGGYRGDSTLGGLGCPVQPGPFGCNFSIQKTTLLFIVFAHQMPADARVHLTSSDALPKWDVLKSTGAMAVIWLHGEMTGISLQIEIGTGE